jgi:hypothetical protein
MSVRRRSGLGDCWQIAAVAIVGVLSVWPRVANAGDMDAVGYAIGGMLVYAGVVVALSIGAIVACLWIADLRWRAVTRFLIVALVYTPVPHAGLYNEIYAQPAFLTILGDHSLWPHSGWLSHPFLLAYGGALALGLPVVLLWAHLSAAYSRTSPAKPNGVA